MIIIAHSPNVKKGGIVPQSEKEGITTPKNHISSEGKGGGKYPEKHLSQQQRCF